jgi:hypothetical protein
MSQLEVDKIIPQSGTTLTIGDSGDTIIFADGATLAIDTNTLAIDSTNNRVGIGNSSPISPLTVGAVQETGTDRASIAVKTISNSLAIGESAIQIEEQSGTEGYFMGVDSTGGLFFSNSGSATKTLYLGDDDNVGIKNSSPSHTLDISDTSTTAKTLRVGQSSGVSTADATMIISNGGTGSAMLRFDYEGTNTDRARIGITSSGQNLQFFTAGNNERMRIDSSGNVGIGATTIPEILTVNKSSNGGITGLSINNNYPTASTASAGTGSGIRFGVNDGSFTSAFGDARGSEILSVTTSTNGRSRDIVFKTDSGGTLGEVMRIDSSGNVLIGGTNTDYVSGGGIQTNGSSGDKLYGMRHTGTTSGTYVADWNTGIAGGGLTSTGNFLRLTDGGNLRFQFKGDGNATCDGSFSGGGADYAEYFEWTDGNSSNEDRIGLSVVLDNGKIREATASDTNIIGVVSANPTVIGDEQPHHWQNKFVTDDFGRVQYETLTTWKWEIDGTTDGYIEGRTDKDIPENATNVESFEHSYERINPNYDENLEYTPRSQRQEWSCVGLMGKLRIKKGQQTDSNWIKIRDISDTVEEWLIK